MSRLSQTRLEELEEQILTLSEYDKLEITCVKGKVKITRKSTKQISFDI